MNQTQKNKHFASLILLNHLRPVENQSEAHGKWDICVIFHTEVLVSGGPLKTELQF